MSLDSGAVDNTPQCDIIDGSDAGKMAPYLMRWRMLDGPTGTWGEAVSGHDHGLELRKDICSLDEVF